MNEVKELSAVMLTETNGGKVLEVQLTGKLAKEDYEHFVPAVEQLVTAHVHRSKAPSAFGCCSARAPGQAEASHSRAWSMAGRSK